MRHKLSMYKEWRKIENLSREEMGETCQIPSVAEVSPARLVQISEFEVREGSDQHICLGQAWAFEKKCDKSP